MALYGADASTTLIVCARRAVGVDAPARGTRGRASGGQPMACLRGLFSFFTSVLWAAASATAAGAGAASEYDAEFVGLKVPDSVVAWEVFPAEVTLRNIGTRPWEGAAIRLRSAAPRGAAVWGTDYVLIAQGTSVAPGAAYTFRSLLRAP
jgi:hypothetical protein